MESRLTRTDLNLLWALHVLLEERNVTRAARRLFVSQPAMSKTLHRLRDEFDDPLFDRLPKGLTPTPRALALIDPLREIFDLAGQCLSPPAFAPGAATGLVRIAAPEQFAVFVVPRLLESFRQEAPHLGIVATHLSGDPLHMLSAGDLDFVIHLEQPVPAGFVSERIYTAAPAVWCRRDHPLARHQRLTLGDVRQYPRLTFRDRNVSAADFTSIAQQIRPTDPGSRIILDTSQLLVAIEAVMRTDAMMLGPPYLSALPLASAGLVALPAGSLLEFARMRIELALVQHTRTTRSPLHRWIAAKIQDCLASAPAKIRAPIIEAGLRRRKGSAANARSGAGKRTSTRTTSRT